ncbi:RNase adapter RapZ [Sphingomicrobium nitratireducens]|uniref:RNase adapter RapZ n=1 Tax=Sphingomicrobium nitratireducens TaxID=2964666 RepID=UPI00223EB664
MSESRRLLVVTGLSGAGKSTVLDTLEDWGWDVVDNLPLALLAAFVAGSESDTPLAVGMDMRSRGFDPACVIHDLREVAGADVEILYLDCAESELARRYDSTRRRHPLASEGGAEEGIARERTLTAPLREAADSLIDTTDYSPVALRNELKRRYSEADGDPTVTFKSFGFSRGLPRAADLMFDMRFVKNPYWEPELRLLTGRDADVRAFVEADPGWAETVERIETLLDDLIPRYWAAGKNYLTVAFGCTGGRHRSVAAAEAMASRLEAKGHKVTVRHRDLAESAPSESTGSAP